MTGEPSGAPETLAGRIQPGAFGDRVHRSRPAELEERMKKSREKRKAKGGFDQDDLDAYAQKRKQQKHVTAVSVLNAEPDGS